MGGVNEETCGCFSLSEDETHGVGINRNRMKSER